jgi:CubicO group peptidase (beta-lactamase class C family)
MTDQVAAITLRQLLTHTSGIPGNGMGSSGAFALAADDAVGLILTYGLLNDPGTVFDYSNSGSHLVGAVLAEATGRPVLDYAREQLFNPLGIKTRPAYEGFDAGEPTSQFEKDGFAWAADRQGIHTGCCWLKLTTPDMLKIGELYLNEGSWKGQRIVSAAWVRDSTTSQVTAEQLGPAGGYGYFWWLDQLRGHRSYAAVGSFGQLMAVVPDLKLVVAVSSRPDGYADEADVGPILDGIVSGLE